MSISFESSGSWDKTEAWLRRMMKLDIQAELHAAGRRGIEALSSATPFETGLTAAGWSYEIVTEGNGYEVVWRNSHEVAGQPLVIMLQLGHGTGTGGYVQGRDFINPAMKPIFDQIERDVRKAVSAA